MKKNLLVLIAITFISISCQKKTEMPDTTSLESYTDSLFQVSVDSSQIAGGAILVYQNGKTMLKKTYGYASLELSASIPNDGVFEIGSVTKQFTAAAILKLVEAKKLSLDDDFTKYLDFDTKGRKVTIDNLLNHTSGIPSFTEINEFLELELSTQDHPRDSLVRLVESKDFLFEPGEALIYNNSGYFFLGLIIEEVTGQTYEEYLKKTFFDPLGMTSTSNSSNTEITKNKVYGYRYTPHGLKQKEYINHIWPYAGGSLWSTTNDLLIWMRAMHEGKIFSDQLYQLYITPGNLNDGSKLRYAMGLCNYSNYGNPVIRHGGGINGFLSETRYFPEADLYLICLVNTIGPKGAGFFANKLTWNILHKQEYQSRELDIELESIEGKYSGQAGGRILSIEVFALSNSIVLSVEGEDDIDTLRTYVGNNTWMDENSMIIFTGDQLRMDHVGGYYKLEKQ